MRKALKWLGIVIGVLLLVGAGIWGLSRAMEPTAAQQQALALMSQTDAPSGRNAYPAIWLLAYDVPEDQWEAVAAEDAARYAAAPNDEAAAADFDWGSVAERRFGRIDLPADERPDYCGRDTVSCLDQIRANRDGYRQWRQQQDKLIARVQDLGQYDYIRNTMPARLHVPFPAMQDYGALPTLRALDFAEGRVDAALDGTCRDVGMWRKFASRSNLLITGMVSVAYDATGASLLAEMLQELPANHPLPPSCKALLAPPKAEALSACNAMRGEFAFSTQSMDLSMQAAGTGSGLGNRLKTRLLYNHDKTVARAAENFAWTCDARAAKTLSADVPLVPPQRNKPGAGDYVRCVGNPFGCILSNIAAPAYSDYAQRYQDMGARAQVLGTLLWLREQPNDTRPLAERIAARPEALKSPARAISVIDNGTALSIPMYETKRGKTWQVPLPSYLQDNPAGQ